MTEQRLDEHTILLVRSKATQEVPCNHISRQEPWSWVTNCATNYPTPQRKEPDRGYYRRTFGR